MTRAAAFTVDSGLDHGCSLEPPIYSSGYAKYVTYPPSHVGNKERCRRHVASYQAMKGEYRDRPLQQLCEQRETWSLNF